ncbi:hypothetical protein ACLOJK_004202 [Asimina triloba]
MYGTPLEHGALVWCSIIFPNPATTTDGHQQRRSSSVRRHPAAATPGQASHHDGQQPIVADPAPSDGQHGPPKHLQPTHPSSIFPISSTDRRPRASASTCNRTHLADDSHPRRPAASAIVFHGRSARLTDEQQHRRTRHGPASTCSISPCDTSSYPTISPCDAMSNPPTSSRTSAATH